MGDTPKLGFPKLVEGQETPYVTHNEALNRLDGVINMKVLDRNLTAPPGGESNGDAYLINTPATEAWLGHDGDIGMYYDGWIFQSPFVPMRIWVNDEGLPLFYNGVDWIVDTGVSARIETKSFTKSYFGNGKFYLAGFYTAPAADVTLNQDSLTQAYGSANVAVGAHAFIVAGGPGSVDAGVVGLKVTGTSMTDGGVRTAADEEILSADITALVLNQKLETVKKWIGQVVFTLYTVSGNPTTYSVDCNYGLCKYDDWSKKDITVTGFEAVGNAGAADTGFNILVAHHKATGWVYSATAFDPIKSVICSMNTDYVTEKNLATGEPFAYKRDNLSQAIDGEDSEGFVIVIFSGTNNAINVINCHISASIIPV